MSADPWQLLAGVDIVVVGAGPAGTAAATTAASAGRTVLLLDASPPGLPFRIGESLPPGAADVVRQVFGPGGFDEAAHLRSHGNRSCWGSPVPADTDFMFNPLGVGWHLDRVAFDAGLVAAAERAGVEVWRQSSLTAAELVSRGSRADRHPGSWHLEVASALGSVELRADLLCDATGRRATIAREHGATLEVDDRLVAVVAVVDSTGRDSTTTVEAAPTGWWYTAAIPSGRRVVAFLTDGDLLDPALRTIDGFRRALDATAHVVAYVDGAGGNAPSDAHRANPTRSELVRSPSIVAAGTTHLDRPVGDRWLAVGDAAAAFDPLSSQGIVTALLMGRAGGELLAALTDDPGTDTGPFEARYATILDRFRAERDATYAMEQRWPDSPFWHRRHHRRIDPDRD